MKSECIIFVLLKSKKQLLMKFQTNVDGLYLAGRSGKKKSTSAVQNWLFLVWYYFLNARSKLCKSARVNLGNTCSINLPNMT